MDNKQRRNWDIFILYISCNDTEMHSPDFSTIEFRQRISKSYSNKLERFPSWGPGPKGVQQGVYIAIANFSHLSSKHRHQSCTVACSKSCDGWQVTQLFQIQSHLTLRVSQNLIIMSG